MKHTVCAAGITVERVYSQPVLVLWPCSRATSIARKAGFLPLVHLLEERLHSYASSTRLGNSTTASSSSSAAAQAALAAVADAAEAMPASTAQQRSADLSQALRLAVQAKQYGLPVAVHAGVRLVAVMAAAPGSQDDTEAAAAIAAAAGPFASEFLNSTLSKVMHSKASQTSGCIKLLKAVSQHKHLWQQLASAATESTLMAPKAMSCITLAASLAGMPHLQRRLVAAAALLVRADTTAEVAVSCLPAVKLLLPWPDLCRDLVTAVAHSLCSYGSISQAQQGAVPAVISLAAQPQLQELLAKAIAAIYSSEASTKEAIHCVQIIIKHDLARQRQVQHVLACAAAEALIRLGAAEEMDTCLKLVWLLPRAPNLQQALVQMMADFITADNRAALHNDAVRCIIYLHNLPQLQRLLASATADALTKLDPVGSAKACIRLTLALPGMPDIQEQLVKAVANSMHDSSSQLEPQLCIELVEKLQPSNALRVQQEKQAELRDRLHRLRQHLATAAAALLQRRDYTKATISQLFTLASAVEAYPDLQHKIIMDVSAKWSAAAAAAESGDMASWPRLIGMLSRHPQLQEPLVTAATAAIGRYGGARSGILINLICHIPRLPQQQNEVLKLATAGLKSLPVDSTQACFAHIPQLQQWPHLQQQLAETLVARMFSTRVVLGSLSTCCKLCLALDSLPALQLKALDQMVAALQQRAGSGHTSLSLMSEILETDGGLYRALAPHPSVQQHLLEQLMLKVVDDTEGFAAQPLSELGLLFSFLLTCPSSPASNLDRFTQACLHRAGNLMLLKHLLAMTAMQQHLGLPVVQQLVRAYVKQLQVQMEPPKEHSWHMPQASVSGYPQVSLSEAAADTQCISSWMAVLAAAAACAACALLIILPGGPYVAAGEDVSTASCQRAVGKFPTAVL